ncbi:structural maintenance of chromosomes protein 5 [Rutidosis leptorrhynchoides]|uniref:structural maintenance of chromosomes protein 5 n=1 Tax=Rutidosis leptorrhynchoides TaxID=125765 RepID=UPI003A990D8A
MGEPRPKRPKITRGEDDYVPGNIVEIEIGNFMTFNHLVCKPGSRLNLVIGPNGSGKSSLVCAIAIGLGGEPQLLGRAATVGAFVKRGEESGYTKITLRGETPNEKIVIMRKIDVRNKSDWLYNGRAISKKEILEIIQKFNIQVNNLTQFLPQDRVCEFAKLSPVRLLEETEKAVGDPRLPFLHRSLVDTSAELQRSEQAVQKNKETLGQLKALNAEQERDVERVRQRDELLAKAESMKKKLPWLKYDMKKAEYLQAKDQEKDAKKKLDETAKLLKEISDPIEKRKQEKKDHDTKYKKIGDLLEKVETSYKQMQEKETQLCAKVKGRYSEMEDLERQEASRQERIAKAEKDLADTELQLQNLPPYKPPKEKVEKLGAAILELEVSAKDKRDQKKEKETLLDRNRSSARQTVEKLREMDNIKNKRLQALRNAGADKINDAYNWVQAHRHELRKEVYGPVLIEVNISNKLHAAYLESHVPRYIWKAFITQDAADRDYLFKNLRSFDVAVINHVADERRNPEPLHISQEMSSIGLYTRLDQVFEAPYAVKEVLIGQAGLESSYIGTKKSDENAEMAHNFGIMDLWTPDNHYRWTKSRYGGHVSASMQSVNDSRLLLSNSDGEELNDLRRKKNEMDETISVLEASLKSIQSEIKELEDAEAELQKQREIILKEAHLEKRKLTDLQSRVNQKRQKLNSMKKEDDMATAMSKLIEDVESLNIQRFKCVLEIKNLLTQATTYRRNYAEKFMSSIELEIKIKEMEASIKQQEKLALQASLHFENCKKEAEEHRQQLAAAKRAAESVAVITPTLEQEFLQMPTTIEELNAAIQDITSQANSILFLNHNILEEYERRQRKIEELSTKLESDEKELATRSQELDSLKGRWLPTLRNLVAQINETFSRNFQEMAVAGEVSLDERGNDFDSYGILIKVKFRQEGELQVLSAHHQSGGERSVSTILYLVSLQDLTNCPFRVVDEINQGMDPINERKMFQQLVRAASQINTPQCFLLTPKLLSDLEYGEACTILTVMNGPWIDQPSEVWKFGGSWGSVMGLVGESHLMTTVE